MSSTEPISNQQNSDVLDKAKKIWKIFGRDTHAGRILHQIYKLPNNIPIDYPPIILKKEKKEKIVPPIKKCPQKTKINYPSPIKPEIKTMSKVDLIPKRKNYEIIKKEIEEMQKNPFIPENKGKDRNDLINKLQKNFKNSRGGLPKKAEMPKAENEENEEDYEKIALKKMKKKDLNYLLQEDKYKKKDIILEKKNPKIELMQLYDQIIGEIEEREIYLREIDHLDEPILKEKVNGEIVDRVSELQKVSELINDIKKIKIG